MNSSVTPSSFDVQVRKQTRPVILLVEDEVVVREITRQVLEHAGYEVLESSGAEEALRIASENAGRIGLLLTDVVMPGVNGADLASKLEAAHPGLVTIFMSGYAENEVLRKVTRSDGFIHIQKPFTVQLLLSRLAEACYRHSNGLREASSASRPV